MPDVSSNPVTPTIPEEDRTHKMMHVSEWRRRLQDLPKGWVLEGVLPITGTVLVEGGTYAGKTQFLATLTVAIAAGIPFAGRATITGPVCWFYLEHQDADLEAHFVRACVAFGVELNDLPIYVLDRSRDWLANEESHVTSGAAWIEEIQPALVVVDCARAAARLPENDHQTAELIGGRVCKAFNGNGKRLTALVHHMTKDLTKGVGSGYWHGAVDYVLTIESLGPTKVLMTPKFHGPTPDPIEFSVDVTPERTIYGPPTTVKQAPKAPEPKVEQRERRIIEAIRAQPGIKGEDLREVLKMGAGTIGPILKSLDDSKRIRKDGSAYFPTPDQPLHIVSGT